MFGHSTMWTSVFFARYQVDFFHFWLNFHVRRLKTQLSSAQFIERTLQTAPRRRLAAPFFFLFLLLCSCVFLLRCLRALALLFCISVLLWWWGVSLRLSGVLLRVALKHRGSVAAGSCCGLWPADSVGRGDCGLAGLSRWRHQGVVGWHFCLADRSHTVPRNPSPRRNGILPWRGAARLFKRAHPTRVNKSHHWLRACVSEWVTTGFESQRAIIERVCS